MLWLRLCYIISIGGRVTTTLAPIVPRQVNSREAYNLCKRKGITCHLLVITMSDSVQVTLSADQWREMGKVLVSAIQREYADSYYYGRQSPKTTGKQPQRSTALTRLHNALAYEVNDVEIVDTGYVLAVGSDAKPSDIHRGYCLAKSLIRSYVANDGVIADNKANPAKPIIPAAPVYRYAKFIASEVLGVTPSLAYSIVKDAADRLNYTVLPFKQ